MTYLTPVARFVALCMAFVMLAFFTVQTVRAADQKETAYERVMRTGTIRCGYITWPPYLMQDLNTGEFSGLAYDLMQALSKELDLKVEWAEETGWGSFHTGLDTGRYDVMCTPVWQSGFRAKIVLLSDPLYFNSLIAIKRKSDEKPYATIDSINKPDVTVAVIDGDITQAVLKAEFPDAKALEAPQMSDGSQNLLDVAVKKADIAFSTWEGMERYNNNNPDSLLAVAANGTPVRLFGNTLAFQKKDYDMKFMFDTALRTIYTSGKAQKIIRKYEPGFYPAATPYVLQTAQ